MLEVWGRPDSINVMKVLWMCAEAGARPTHYSTHPHQRADQASGLNPNERIPVINDDGFVLWESNAIVRYVAYKYGLGSLYPTDLRARAEAEQWMDWQQTTVAPPLAYPWHALVRNRGASPDATMLDRSRRELDRVFAILDRHLEEQAFVLGAAFTMADVPLGVTAWRWSALPLERGAFPRVDRWLATLAEREAFQAHVAAHT